MLQFIFGEVEGVKTDGAYKPTKISHRLKRNSMVHFFVMGCNYLIEATAIL